MKHRRISALLAAVMALTLATGCDIADKISSSVDDMINNDANIGKNMPAVGTLAGGETYVYTTAEQTEATETVVISRNEAFSIKADEMISRMTDEQKIGQLILARMPEDSVQVMLECQLGGYTMYADDFKNADTESVRKLTSDIDGAAAVSPFIAVDEEGGNVVRVSSYTQFRSEPFSSPQLLYGRGGTDLLEYDTAEKADLLLGLGINLNLGPVADITDDEAAYIYPRTLGQNTQDTANGIAAIVRAANEKNLASCLKHFPGYGANVDTHTGSAEDGRALYELRSTDFVPFKAGVGENEEKVPAVMVNHNVYQSIDGEVPASLSAKIHGILREELDFNGVIITDDLGMDAIKKFAGEGSPYVLAVNAGNDMLCVTDYRQALADITEAYANGEITPETLDEHVKRILIMKQQYAVLDDIKEPSLPKSEEETEVAEETSVPEE